MDDRKLREEEFLNRELWRRKTGKRLQTIIWIVDFWAKSLIIYLLILNIACLETIYNRTNQLSKDQWRFRQFCHMTTYFFIPLGFDCCVILLFKFLGTQRFSVLEVPMDGNSLIWCIKISLFYNFSIRTLNILSKCDSVKKLTT